MIEDAMADACQTIEDIPEGATWEEIEAFIVEAFGAEDSPNEIEFNEFKVLCDGLSAQGPPAPQGPLQFAQTFWN